MSNQPIKYMPGTVLRVVKNCSNVRQAGLKVGDVFTATSLQYYGDNGGLPTSYYQHIFYRYNKAGSMHNIPQDAVELADMLDSFPPVECKV